MKRRRCVGWASPTNDSRPNTLVGSAHPTAATGFTLVEMLVAMAITLVMMAAVVTLFANVSNSVRDRRATTVMNEQIRGVRNVLQQDLAGATCPGLTWQRPESNHGYIEVIEGPRREGDASLLIDGNVASPTNPEIDHNASILPSSDPKTLPFKDPNWATDGGGLGDGDDILMLTVRNERKPFVGRGPSDLGDDTTSDGDPAGFGGWDYETIESPLAEVIWFAIENPGYTDATLTDPSANHFYGEPGMRTIYRRTLLIVPWLNPYNRPEYLDRNGLVKGLGVKPVPGLLRLLPSTIGQANIAEAIASLIAFQDKYDISCRVEWDYNLKHWKIVANTLGDLTKRENRYAHFGYLAGASSSKPGTRVYPFAVISNGSGYSGVSQQVAFVADPEIPRPNGANDPAKATANLETTTKGVVSYTNDPANLTDANRLYSARPFAYVDEAPNKGVPATAWAMLNDDGAVVRVMQGPMPLWGTRRGEDVMLTDALGFDLRVYDPGAPLFATVKTAGLALTDPAQSLDVVLAPSDPGWRIAYSSADNTTGSGNSLTSLIGKNNAQTGVVYPYAGQGAYVDLGYGFGLPDPYYSPNFSSSALPWFFTPRALVDVFNNQLAPGYAVYDTWSFHYENDGINEDDDEIENGKWQIDNHNNQGLASIDEGTNGLDDYGHYYNTSTGTVDTDIRLGVDDVGERETTPPYDKPLRGIQAVLRAYERDSRAIRQVRVNQHFMAE